jgi:2-dehydro-3-deoxyphosphogluconate aldolase/(4S)-4-hydroxy-2-oxoglutarate aldolase
MPQIPLVPTGGVNVDNIGDFVKAGIAAVGIGNGLARKDLIANKDYKGLTENAKRFKDAFEKAQGRRD